MIFNTHDFTPQESTLRQMVVQELDLLCFLQAKGIDQIIFPKLRMCLSVHVFCRSLRSCQLSSCVRSDPLAPTGPTPPVAPAARPTPPAPGPEGPHPQGECCGPEGWKLRNGTPKVGHGKNMGKSMECSEPMSKPLVKSCQHLYR